MVYSTLTVKALRFVYHAFRGIEDPDGLPHVFHVFHLAEQMPDEESVLAALLHDVTVKTALTPEDLKRAGFPERVLAALRALSRGAGQTDAAYLEAVRADPIARRVKIADLLDERQRAWGQEERAGVAALTRNALALERLENE